MDEQILRQSTEFSVQRGGQIPAFLSTALAWLGLILALRASPLSMVALHRRGSKRMRWE